MLITTGETSLEGLAPRVEEWLGGRIDQYKNSLTVLQKRLDYLEAHRKKLVASKPNKRSGSNGCDNQEDDGCAMDEVSAADCLVSMSKIMAKVTK